MTKFKTVWFWHSNKKAAEEFSFVMSFYDDAYQKPSMISDIKSPCHAYCHSFNTIDDSGHQIVHLVSDDFLKSKPLWYVLIDAHDQLPHMRTLMAFDTDDFPDGTVVPFSDINQSKVSPQACVGYIRWFVDDSRMQQIYVHPDWRRKRISIRLISVADLFIVSDNQWNGSFLNGGDITTEQGEMLRSAWSSSTRLIPKIGSVEGS